MSYSASFDEGSSTLALRGEIDEAAGVLLRDEITKYSSDFSRTIRVDLTAVDYFPSLAVGVLATARRKAEQAGSDLVLAAAEGTVAQRVLTICNLEHETV